MKPCAYCGRENQDEVSSCRECGTIFAEWDNLTWERELTWARHTLRFTLGCFGLVLAIFCFYLLSLGPVIRYLGTITPLAPVPTPAGVTMVAGKTYPSWVGVVYYPAFSLLSGRGSNRGLRGIYQAYIQWCETPRTHDP